MYIYYIHYVYTCKAVLQIKMRFKPRTYMYENGSCVVAKCLLTQSDKT